MREEWQKWKDLVVASGIILVLLASSAGGQVDVSLLSRDDPGETAQSALLALEKSRDALLEARETIDAALRDVDLAMVSLEATARPGRGRGPVPSAARGPAGLGAREWTSASFGQGVRYLSGKVRGWKEALLVDLRAWGSVFRSPAPDNAPAARSPGEAKPSFAATGVAPSSAKENAAAPCPAAGHPRASNPPRIADSLPAVSPALAPALAPVESRVSAAPGAAASRAAPDPVRPDPASAQGREGAVLPPPGAARATDGPESRKPF